MQLYLRNPQMDVTICLDPDEFQTPEHYLFWQRHYYEHGYRNLTDAEHAELTAGKYEVRKWRSMARQ